MTDTYTLLLKISLVIFMAGNLMDMGLRLNPVDAIKGLRNIPFVVHTLVWGFIVGPAVAYVITLIIPLEPPYAMGLILLGMTPCAPFVPLFVDKAKGDLGYTASFMLLVAIATIVFMPFAVPFMVTGLSVSAWAIAKPLIIMILIPLIIGMVILHFSADIAGKIQPYVKKITALFTIFTFVLIIIVYGEGIISVEGSLAVASQLIFFLILTVFTYWFGFGLKHEQKIILSVGMSTRNLGAAIAPLFSAAAIDQRAIVMVVLGLPLMVLFAMLSVKWFGKPPLTNNKSQMEEDL
ncbi:MAG: BASS family bile acid:Na+ symporter [Desulforhopalus sp.]|jgi:BASS family bile acid:Na+ symporter